MITGNYQARSVSDRRSGSSWPAEKRRRLGLVALSAPVRRAIFGIASVGILICGSGEARASAGCDAVDAGTWNVTQTDGPAFSQKTVTGFVVGDKITFTITGINATLAASAQWWIASVSAPGTLLVNETIYVDKSVVRTYTVTGNGGDTSLNQVLRFQVQHIGQTVSVTASCGNRPVTGATNSQKLRAVQVQGSAMAAQTSGAAITGAVGNAINDAFANGGSPVTFSPNGMTFNFAAEPDADVASRSDVSRRADDAFAALAYAGGGYIKAPRAAPVFERQWSLWADIRGTGWDRNNAAGGDLRGTQVNATAGIGYKLRPDVLVGVFAGYENFNYDFVSLAGNLKGSGGTLGGYAAWRIAPTLRWDAMAGWSGLSYDGVAGTANGSFTGSRWIASTGLTGNYRVAAFVFEPSAKVYALWEHQGAWTDSLKASQASRDFATGRISTGGRVIAPWQMSGTTTLSPYLGFYGDWRFATDNALPVGVPFVGLNDGWSGRVTGGVNIATAGGGSLALGGEYGGIGANYGVWTANARANWPF